ncbi:MAG TPA: ATP-binding protein, partial [Kribbella sp.]|nr:ATP-binding protein [Kribbella sp.]
GPVAKHITAVGSIKWLERKSFDVHDLSRLHVHRAQLPGASESTPLLAVARAGVVVDGVQAVGPEQLLSAWG